MPPVAAGVDFLQEPAAIFGAMLWVAMSLLSPNRPPVAAAPRRFALAVVALVFMMIITGGFVAGIRAGFAYNTFPLMNGHLIPPEAMPYKTALTFTYDCGEFEGNMLKASELAELDGFAARRRASKKNGRLRGIGCALFLEPSGGAGKEEIRIEISSCR